MDGLLPILALFTLGAVIVFAMISKKRTEDKLDNPRSRPSSLARQTPDPNFLPDGSLQGATNENPRP